MQSPHGDRGLFDLFSRKLVLNRKCGWQAPAADSGDRRRSGSVRTLLPLGGERRVDLPVEDAEEKEAGLRSDHGIYLAGPGEGILNNLMILDLDDENLTSLLLPR